MTEHECDWRPGGALGLWSCMGPCEGPVAQGDPFVIEGIYELEEGEEDMWLCDKHLAERADQI